MSTGDRQQYSGRAYRTMDNSLLILKLFFIFLYLPRTSIGQICRAPDSVFINENNKVDDVVTNIAADDEVTIESDTDEFKIQGKQLLAAKVFDYETSRSHQAKVRCTKRTTNQMLSITIIVFVNNVNDNPPVFDQKTYNVNVSEMTPVGSSIGHFAATDLDKPPQLYYILSSESNAFRLRSTTDPDLLMNTLLDYDKVQKISLVLYAQDKEPTATGEVFTASATIVITVFDVDNRPPWFQPCKQAQLGVAVICQGDGYRGRVILNQIVSGVLPLKPGPLYAIDGDSGINDEITYSFLNGSNEQFQVDAVTGNITMLKPPGNLETIYLTVVAAQKNNMNQFATTTVKVYVESVVSHPPVFEKKLYRGTVSAVGSMAVTDEGPLLFSAKDGDYPQGVNPYIKYSINEGDGFIVIDAYLFLNNSLPPGEVSISVVATDIKTDEFDTAKVIVEVKQAAQPPSSSKSSDMVALGVTLAILLFVCLVIIGILVTRIRKEKVDWMKIYQVNEFRSSLGQSLDGKKESIQYTNKVYQSSEDDQSMDNNYSKLEVEKANTKEMSNVILREAAVKSPPVMPPVTVDSDPVDQTDKDKANNEREVKSILIKDRRNDEGYKAVWFVEDIDPDAKDMVVPDNSDSDEENNSPVNETPEENPDDTDTDMDSGVGVKIEDSLDKPDDDNNNDDDI